MKYKLSSIFLIVAVLLQTQEIQSRFIKLGIEDTIKDSLKHVHQLFIPQRIEPSTTTTTTTTTASPVSLVGIELTPNVNSSTTSNVEVSSSPDGQLGPVSEVGNSVSETGVTPGPEEEGVTLSTGDDDKVTETIHNRTFIDAPVRSCPPGTLSVGGRCKKNFGR